MGSSGYLVMGLLEKMESTDTDFRYMATNDLMNELQKDNFSLEETTEKRVVLKVLDLMNDANGEVQNLAVKCLAPLVKKVRELQLVEIVNKLCEYTMDTKKDELRDIAGIGLKTVIVEIPTNSSNSVLQQLIPKLLNQLENDSATYEVQMDTLDILSEILARFGPLVANNPDLQRRIQDVLVPLLSHARPAFRKRTTIALGNLVTNTPDELFNKLVQQLLIEFNKASNQHDKLKTLIQSCGTLSRSSAPRFGKHLPQFLPLVISNVNVDDDELRENCLQALESFVLRCPTEITPNINNIIQLCLQYLKYDPNYADDEEEEEEELMDQDDQMNDDNEEEESDIEDYSDDDDMSWKVRRSSSKLLAAIIGTRHELLSQLYQQVAPALVNRFKEREESVRVDILQTFIILLRQTLVYSGESYSSRSTGHDSKRLKADIEMETSDSPKHLLRALVPKLSRNLSKQLVTKSITTKQTGFSLLRELVTVLNGGLENHIHIFIPAIQNSLSITPEAQHHQTSTNSNLKIEALTFLRQLFKVHQPYVFHKHLDRLCPPIISSVSDKFYKITSEAFLVCIELIKVIRPIDNQSLEQSEIQPLDPDFKQYILQIYEVTISRLKTLDVDQEVKERSILCLGVLLSQAGDNLKPQLLECMPLLLERLRNEVTRLTAVKTFTSIADSAVCVDPQVTYSVLKAVDEVALLLRKSQRQLKVASLICLEVFVKRYGDHLKTQTYSLLLAELTPHISDQDLHLLPLALNNVVAILVANPQNIHAVNKDVLPKVFQLVESSIVQGAALESLLTFFVTVVKTKESGFPDLLSGLITPALTQEQNQLILSKQSYSTIAQCIAALSLSSQANLSPTVTDFTKKIENPDLADSITYLSLLTLGEIGRKIDLSDHQDLHLIILGLFSASSEEVKSAAAFALGNVAVGNVAKYLPIIISEIRADPKKQYLLLHALKEVITRYSNEEGIQILGPFASETWNILFVSGEVVEEGTRNVVAECVGKLTLADPYKFLPELQKRLRSSSPQTRGTVVTAIKYTFTNQGQQYDELLRPLIVDFLSLIKDSDLNVRRLSLSTLNSAAHSKPYLIRDVLDQLLPLLYEETIIKEDLIHMVEMGPFKHKVDDGLDLRKSAYECMSTLLDTCRDRLDIFKFLDRVLAGLTDVHDIAILSHAMLIRLAEVAPTAVQQKMDDAVEPFKATLTYKLKENAIKSEIEKQQDLVRSALRVTAILAHLAEQGSTPKFDNYLKETKNGPLAETYKAVEAEVENREFNFASGGDVNMDLSN